METLEFQHESDDLRKDPHKNGGIKEEVKQFLGNTTLHGMKQATDQETIPLRR